MRDRWNRLDDAPWWAPPAVLLTFLLVLGLAGGCIEDAEANPPSFAKVWLRVDCDHRDVAVTRTQKATVSIKQTRRDWKVTAIADDGYQFRLDLWAPGDSLSYVTARGPWSTGAEWVISRSYIRETCRGGRRG